MRRHLRRPTLPCHTLQLDSIFEAYNLALPPSSFKHASEALLETLRSCTIRARYIFSLYRIFRSSGNAGPRSFKWQREPSPFMVTSPKHVFHQRSRGHMRKVIDLSFCTHSVWGIHETLSSCQYKCDDHRKRHRTYSTQIFQSPFSGALGESFLVIGLCNNAQPCPYFCLFFFILISISNSTSHYIELLCHFPRII